MESKKFNWFDLLQGIERYEAKIPAIETAWMVVGEDQRHPGWYSARMEGHGRQ
jgi:hypothetical protein